MVKATGTWPGSQAGLPEGIASAPQESTRFLEAFCWPRSFEKMGLVIEITGIGLVLKQKRCTFSEV